MSTYLLDANVLIALTVAEHEYHAQAGEWLAGTDAFAVCPITEGALTRFLIRVGEATATTVAILDGIRHHPRCAFWPDAVSYADVDLRHVRGHRQVADAYLVGLAVSRHARLATFDRALAGAYGASVELIHRGAATIRTSMPTSPGP